MLANGADLYAENPNNGNTPLLEGKIIAIIE